LLLLLRVFNFNTLYYTLVLFIESYSLLSKYNPIISLLSY
jgi:hypothetical protein